MQIEQVILNYLNSNNLLIPFNVFVILNRNKSAKFLLKKAIPNPNNIINSTNIHSVFEYSQNAKKIIDEYLREVPYPPIIKESKQTTFKKAWADYDSGDESDYEQPLNSLLK